MNPVPPSPWRSSAPRGFCRSSKSSELSSTGNQSLHLRNCRAQIAKPRVHRQPNILKENVFFKNLNRSTLILSFPQLHPNQIDAALALSDNDLSEAIRLLRLRVRVLENRKLYTEHKNACKSVPLVPVFEPPKVNYISTKYNDVQIVEIAPNDMHSNGMKIMEVSNNALHLLETCKTTMLLPQVTISRDNIRAVKTNTVIAASQNTEIQNYGSSGSQFSPAANSSVSSDDSDKLKVYDFAEDEPVLYHLPKPSRKPLNKVGIVLRKDKFGLSVKLL